MGLETRDASKLILETGLPNERQGIALVANSRGHLNLPGGGLKEGESSLQALMREADEEMGLRGAMLLDEPRALGGVSDKVTTRHGVPLLARWTVYRAQLAIPVAELRPCDTTIRQIKTVEYDQIFRSPMVTDMVKLAIWTFGASRLSEPAPEPTVHRTRPE